MAEGVLLRHLNWILLCVQKEKTVWVFRDLAFFTLWWSLVKFQSLPRMEGLFNNPGFGQHKEWFWHLSNESTFNILKRFVKFGMWKQFYRSSAESVNIIVNVTTISMTWELLHEVGPARKCVIPLLLDRISIIYPPISFCST